MSTTLEETLMSDEPIEPSEVRPRPALVLDLSLYETYLADAEIPEEQRRALLETLWQIVVGFVDLGFDLHPVQQVETGDTEDLSSVVRLMVHSDGTINGDRHNQHTQEAP